MRKYLASTFKKGIKTFGLFTALFVGLQSCDDKAEKVVNKPTLYIVTEGPVEVSTYGGKKPIEFLSNIEWEISSDVSWLTFEGETTGSQSDTINVVLEKNESGVERTATVTMTARDIVKTLIIIQKYRDTSTPQLVITTPSPIKVDFENNNKPVAFICNVNWTATSDVDWITFEGASSGLEDATLNLKIAKNEGSSTRNGTISIDAGGLIKTIQLQQRPESLVGVNLLDTPEEDYSFEAITRNQAWPPLGEWGGSATSGIGRFGSSSTAIRVSAASPSIRTGTSYLFLRMRNNETTSSLDWLWRKLSGLIPGRSYTFSFWYKTPPSGGSFTQTGNIRLGVVQNVNDAATLANPLNGETTFGFVPVGPGEAGSVDEFKQVSHTFTVPAGKTELYVSWVRNGNQQPFIDDMSLVLNP